MILCVERAEPKQKNAQLRAFCTACAGGFFFTIEDINHEIDHIIRKLLREIW